MKEAIIEAKSLRNSNTVKNIPNKTGYYKWFAGKEDLITLLNALNLKFDNIPSEEWDVENGLYCIYVGIAKTSVRQRLNWHVNDKHDWKRIKNGRLSTLRKTISSILFHDQSKKDETNSFIDKLIIHYYFFEQKDSYGEQKIEVERIEEGLINKGLHVLNIAKNRNEYRSREITKLRNEAKEKALEIVK